MRAKQHQAHLATFLKDFLPGIPLALAARSMAKIDELKSLAADLRNWLKAVDQLTGQARELDRDAQRKRDARAAAESTHKIEFINSYCGPDCDGAPLSRSNQTSTVAIQPDDCVWRGSVHLPTS